MITIDAKVSCDLSWCENQADMKQPLEGPLMEQPMFLLPDGWIRFRQGGVAGLVGTAPLPLPKGEAFVHGLTFCCVDHALLGIAEVAVAAKKQEPESDVDAAGAR